MANKLTLTDYYRELNDFYGEEVYELGYSNEKEDAEYDMFFNSYYEPSNTDEEKELLEELDEELNEAGKLIF